MLEMRQQYALLTCWLAVALGDGAAFCEADGGVATQS